MNWHQPHPSLLAHLLTKTPEIHKRSREYVTSCCLAAHANKASFIERFLWSKEAEPAKQDTSMKAIGQAPACMGISTFRTVGYQEDQYATKQMARNGRLKTASR